MSKFNKAVLIFVVFVFVFYAGTFISCLVFDLETAPLPF